MKKIKQFFSNHGSKFLVAFDILLVIYAILNIIGGAFYDTETSTIWVGVWVGLNIFGHWSSDKVYKSYQETMDRLWGLVKDQEELSGEQNKLLITLRDDNKKLREKIIKLTKKPTK